MKLTLSLLSFSFQLVLIKIVECIYRIRSKKRPKNSTQLNHSANINSQVEEERTLTRTFVRNRRPNGLNDYAVIVANLYKTYERYDRYDDSDAVRDIDFAVKRKSQTSEKLYFRSELRIYDIYDNDTMKA